MDDPKQALRERIWDDLEDSGEARFPFPPHGRIPNFAGADAAADRLADQPEWREAETIKANPDAPQLPVRRRALREGKTVYMAVARLREAECFLRLDPAELEDYDAATTVSGSAEHGVPVGPADVESIDLIVSGSVAVRAEPRSAEKASGESREESAEPRSAEKASGESREPGARIGKGEGYSDLEYAILREFDRVDADTTVATTVHERQLVTDPIETGAHDVPMDLVVTPERVRRPEGGERPDGIDWGLLDAERVAEIPVLETLR